MRALKPHELRAVSGGILQHQDIISQDFGGAPDPVFSQVYQFEGQGEDVVCPADFVSAPEGGTEEPQSSGGYCEQAQDVQAFCTVVGGLGTLLGPVGAGISGTCGLAALGAAAYEYSQCP